VRRIFEEARSSQDFLPALLAKLFKRLVQGQSFQREGALFSRRLGLFIC
jgi:hypothetical protein